MHSMRRKQPLVADPLRGQMSQDHALVLFNLLSHRDQKLRDANLDQAECVVLDDLLAVLESELSEPFLENYDELVQASRLRIMKGSLVSQS